MVEKADTGVDVDLLRGHTRNMVQVDSTGNRCLARVPLNARCS